MAAALRRPPGEHQPKIFDRYHRNDKGCRGAEGGARLGLAMAKVSVERPRGRITLPMGKCATLVMGSQFLLILGDGAGSFDARLSQRLARKLAAPSSPA